MNKLLRDILPTWQAELLSGKPPVRWKCGEGELSKIHLSPGRILMIGAPPGVGKTALTMQLVFDCLHLNPQLKAVVCNIEMSPSDLLDRELSRCSGVPAKAIEYRLLEPYKEQILEGIGIIKEVEDRLTFCTPPFSLENVAKAADDHKADLIVLDYIQRIPLSNEKQTKDLRNQMNDSMAMIRRIANEFQKAIIVVSSVSRGQDNYRGLGLASFKESAELEFGADDAYLLQENETADTIKMKHVKHRRGKNDIELKFIDSNLSFESKGQKNE